MVKRNMKGFEKVECECGASIARHSMSDHKNSAAHTFTMRGNDYGIGAFLADKCEFNADEKWVIKAKDLFDAYNKCETGGYLARSQFGKRVKRQGMNPNKCNTGTFYIGLRLKPIQIKIDDGCYGLPLKS